MDNLLSDALSLMLVGMGFVFIFLTILVFVTSSMSAMVNKFFPVAEPQPKVSAMKDLAKPEDDEQLLAVISIAVTKYRAKHKRKF